MTATKTTFFFLVFALGFLDASMCYGQTPKAISLEMRIPEIRASKDDIITVLGTLSSDYQIPIGFERTLSKNSGSGDVKLSFSLKNLTLKDVLNEIIRRDRMFSWTFDGNVIHVVPSESNRFSKQISECKIHRFTLEERIDYLSLRDRLTSVPEVKELLRKRGISPLNVDLFSSDFSQTPFSISLVDTTLSNILDKIVQQGSNKMWILTVTERADENAELVLNFV